LKINIRKCQHYRQKCTYATYIDLYNKSHIVLDQVFSYDQGYNALEAMAKGKVVLQVKKEFEEYYQLNDPVCINALPNVESLVSSLSYPHRKSSAN
jgi:hypothetical protein